MRVGLVVGLIGAPVVVGLIGAPAFAGDGLPRVGARAARRGFDGPPPAPPPPREEPPKREGPSRWSNEGAETPIPSPVPVTAPVPERNRPRPVGVETPGQSRVDDTDLLSARVALSGYRLTTVGQDLVYADELGPDGQLVRLDRDRDIELLRARLTFGYERIGGSWFSTRVDAELRPRLGGPGRPDDQRVGAAYLAWGLTRRHRPDSPDFGVALGRIPVPEAGGAQVDGVLVRWRPLERLGVGAFGGLTGFPYGYNWRLREAQTFSSDWVTGGAFASWRGAEFQASVAGAVTAATVPRPPPDPGDLDRVYLHGDLGWQPTRDLSLRVRGTFDLLPEGQSIQSARVGASWTPGPARVTLSVGRYATVVYRLSLGYGFAVDPLGGRYEAGGPPIVDEDGRAVVPFDAARLVAVYDEVQLGLGWRLDPRLDVFARASLRVRDPSTAESLALEAVAPGAVPLADTVAGFAAARFVPTVGVRFADPAWLDARARVTGIVDPRAQADAITRLALGRELFEGARLAVDGRWVAGEIDGLDGGATASYRLPRGWGPGRLGFRLSYRYFQETVAVERPASDDQVGPLDPDASRAVIPTQESHLGFFGLDWRL